MRVGGQRAVGIGLEKAAEAGDGLLVAGLAEQVERGLVGAGLGLRVGLRWLSPEDTLAGIRGATNALELDVEYLGKLVCAGPGAGRVETAYALLSDLMTLDMGRGGADG